MEHRVYLSILGTKIKLAFVLSSMLLSNILFPAQSAADPICIPNAIGVPGQSGPPAWWDGNGAMDDPRWQGAMSQSHAGGDAQFRALRYLDGTQKYLVLSWQVSEYPAGPATTSNDILYVGFYHNDTVTPANSFGHIIAITRTSTTTTTDGTHGSAFSAEVYFRDSTTSGGWSPLPGLPPPVPSWIADDALLNSTCTGGMPPVCDTWSIRLRVPIGTADPVSNPANGLPLPDTFNMWYELHTELGSSLLSYHKFPVTASNASPPTFPDPTSWNEVTVSSGATCAGGVSIISSQITTDNAVSTQISTANPNVFHARPSNDTGGPIAGDDIKARFRIANWGSVLFDSPEWIDIAPSSPSCATATGSSANVPSPGNFDLTCTWDLTEEQKCAYRPDIHNSCSPMPTQRNQHQCILVELSSNVGVLFTRVSAWNNMNFVTTSVFERNATISIKGLPALPTGPKRDVYLYVETQNMPVAPSEEAPQGEDDGEDDGQDEPRKGQKQQRDKDKRPLIRPVGTKEGERYKQMVRSGRMTFAQVAKVMPTYIVHVYYDTGERISKDGKELIVVETMPSFGYFAMHDGEIEGWKHSLQGAEEIAPNLYKIGVAHDGSIDVRTRIATVEPTVGPVEPPEEDRSWIWWLAIGIGLALLLLLLWWLRRSQNP